MLTILMLSISDGKQCLISSHGTGAFFLKVLSWLSPLRYANDAIQEIIIPNRDNGVMLANMAILLAYAVLLLLVASLTLKETE